jgi:hypothetical protein
MAHAVTGDGGALSFVGVALNGKLQEWTAEVMGQHVSDRGAGDTGASRAPTFIDWKVTAKAFLKDQADMGIVTVSTVPKSAIDLVNTEVAIAPKIKTGDTNPFFTGTGLVTNIKHTHAIEKPHEYEITVECSTGSLPTMDATPAT